MPNCSTSFKTRTRPPETLSRSAASALMDASEESFLATGADGREYRRLVGEELARKKIVPFDGYVIEPTLEEVVEAHRVVALRAYRAARDADPRFGW